MLYSYYSGTYIRNSYIKYATEALSQWRAHFSLLLL